MLRTPGKRQCRECQECQEYCECRERRENRECRECRERVRRECRKVQTSGYMTRTNMSSQNLARESKGFHHTRQTSQQSASFTTVDKVSRLSVDVTTASVKTNRHTDRRRDVTSSQSSPGFKPNFTTGNRQHHNSAVTVLINNVPNIDEGSHELINDSHTGLSDSPRMSLHAAAVSTTVSMPLRQYVFTTVDRSKTVNIYTCTGRTTDLTTVCTLHCGPRGP